MNSSKKIGKFPKVSNFHCLFLKLDWFDCNRWSLLLRSLFSVVFHNLMWPMAKILEQCGGIQIVG
jgi:hypothetical protein